MKHAAVHLALFLSYAILGAACSEETLQGVEYECQTNLVCNDGDPCTDDSCSAEFTCLNLPKLDGDACEDDSLIGICVAGTCGESVCGDGYVDSSLVPAEQCDDGNLEDHDGCARDCTHGAPDIIIDFPDRGETFDGDANITILGHVDDKGVGLEQLHLNGEMVVVAPDGSFEHTVHSVFGLNMIHVEVVNLAGQHTLKTRGYYYAQEWWDGQFSPNDAAPLADRLAYRLGQEAFDDDDHPCATLDGVYTCEEVDDLATVGEIILNGLSIHDFGEAISVYEQELELLNQPTAVSFEPIELDGIGMLTISGEIGVFGAVTLKSEVVDLNLREVRLSLTSRDGGLDADVSVDSNVNGPGFDATVRTSASVNLEARFTSVGVVLETDFVTLNSLDLVCLFIPPGPPWNTICPDSSGGPLAPLGALEPDPTAWLDSSLAIERMLLETGFDIETPAQGEVDVQLVHGNVDFQGGDIDLSAVEDMQIDLGGISILGGLSVVDLGVVDLGFLADGISAFTDPLLSFMLSDLQFALEPAINILLLNPSDPLSVGSVVQDFIMGLGTNGPLALAPHLADGLSEPLLTLDTELSSLHFAAPRAGDLRTGGMTIGFATSTHSQQGTTRNPLGAPLRSCAGESQNEAWDSGQSMDAARHLDLVNQALLSAFWSGALQGALPAAWLENIPASNDSIERVQASVTPLTAPMLNDCSGNLRLEWADLQISGQVASQGEESEFTGFVSTSIPVEMQVAQGELLMVVDESRALKQIWEVTGEQASVNTPESVSFVMTKVAENLGVQYGGAVIAALPGVAFDLGAMFQIEHGVAVVMEPTLVRSEDGRIHLAGQPLADGGTPTN